MLASLEVPQADRLESVLQAIIAVDNGHRTDVEISMNVESISNDRQGRYYRKAAEILGFITTDSNKSRLTDAGLRLMDDPCISNPIFVASILHIDVMQLLIQYFEIKGHLSRLQITNYLKHLPGIVIGENTLDRRVSTILSWLRALKILDERDGKFSLSSEPTCGLPLIEMSDNLPCLFPENGLLKEYETVQIRSGRSASVVEYLKDQAKLDRAVSSHRRLVNLVADRILQAGGIPKTNMYIDLATRLEGDFIFEMKSCNPGNQWEQVRKGCSQLYEYRYLQKSSKANLVLVVENRLVPKNRWLLDYLEKDRKIFLLWDGNDTLYGSSRARDELSFLQIESAK